MAENSSNHKPTLTGLARRLGQLPSDKKRRKDERLPPYQPFELTVIRPQKALMVDIQDFNVEDIEHMIERGYHTAKEQLKGRMRAK